MNVSLNRQSERLAPPQRLDGDRPRVGDGLGKRSNGGCSVVVPVIAAHSRYLNRSAVPE